MKIRSLSPRLAAGCAAAAVLTAMGGQALADPAPSYETLIGQTSAAPLNIEATALVDDTPPSSNFAVLARAALYLAALGALAALFSWLGRL